MLVPHLITALADEDANGTSGKNIVASAVCTMHDAETGGNAIILYDDENGSNGATSKLTDANGQVVVYATPGEYWKSVNGGTRRKVVVGNVGAFYGTAAEIAALRPIRDGQIAYATDRANAPLISSTTATAQPGDITAANGNVWVLQVGANANVLSFGEYDGSDISPLVESVLNSGRAKKYHLSGEFAALTHAEISVSDVIIDLTGATIDCTAMAYDSGFQGGGAWLRFRGSVAKNATVVGSLTALDKTATLTDATSVQVGDIIRLSSSEPVYTSGSIIAYKLDINRIADVNGSDITFDYPIFTDWDGSTYPISAEILRPIRDCHVIGGELIGGGATESPLQNGRGQSAVFFYAVDNFSVKGSVVKNMFANAISCERSINGLWSGIEITGRDFDVTPVEGVNSSWYGMYAIRSRAITMEDSIGVRVRHMCDAAQSISVTQANNRSTDSHRAAFGTHEAVYDCNIVDNICESGYSGVTIRSLDAIVSGNVINADVGITTAVMDKDDEVGELVITGNRIRTTGSNASLSITGIYETTIADNIIKGSPRGVLLATERIVNTSISDNIISSATGVEVDPPAGGMDSLVGLDISDNVFKGVTANAVEVRGSTNIANPADGISISGNKCYCSSSGSAILLRGEGYYGENIEVTYNKMFGDTSACVQITNPQHFAYHPIVENNSEYNKAVQTNRGIGRNSSASAGSGSNVLRGSKIERTLSATGQPSAWVCVESGTEGSISGVTGDITSGTDSLTLTGNDATKVLPGMFITISGAGAASADLDARVLSMSEDLTTATIDTNASTTVSGSSVSRNNPTYGVVSTIS